jgi:hypothetical protein
MSAEYNKTWTDKNYVPCEGLGLTATGQIELTIKYDKKHWVRFAEEGQPAPEFDYYDIRSIFLETSYNHAHEASATLDYQGAPLVDEGGGKQTVRLVKPWYDVMTDGDSKLLVGPKTRVSGQPKPTQQRQWALTRPLKLNVNVRFPQDGGNCFASFNQEIQLP